MTMEQVCGWEILKDMDMLQSPRKVPLRHPAQRICYCNERTLIRRLELSNKVFHVVLSRLKNDVESNPPISGMDFGTSANRQNLDRRVR